MTLLSKFKFFVKKYRLLEKEDKVIVGVSGGPDSVALLYLLLAVSPQYRLKLHVAHLDHQLREDSSKDAEFVLELARKLNITAEVKKIKISNSAKGSIEETARNARLDFFFSAAKRFKAKKIALGHTRDDQAETVLMRLLRGAGLSGLSGISSKKDMRGFQIIRPLIEISRQEIEGYLKKKRVQPRLDSSNLEDIFFRNKVRNRLLPLLQKEYNANIKEVLSAMAQSVSSDYDYLNCAARKISGRFSGRLGIKKFLALHPSMRRMILRMNIARLRGDTRRIDFRHISEIEDLIANRPVNSIVHLPRGLFVIKKKNSISFKSSLKK